MNPKKTFNKLVKELFNEDDLGSVIRSHIIIESLLSNIIEITSPNKKYIKKMELDFDKKVTLALLLGFNEEYAKPLRVLGKLRNSFAHKPNMVLTKSDVKNIYISLNTEAKENIQQTFKDLKNQNKSLEKYNKFHDILPAEQFKLIVINIWAQIQSTVVILNEENA